MVRISLILCFTLFALGLLAQDVDAYLKRDVRAAYEKNTLIFQVAGFEKNGMFLSNGVFRQELKRELRKSEEAWELFKKSRRQVILGTVIVILSVPIGIGFGVASLNPIAGVFAGAIPYGLGTVVSIRGSNNYQRSIWIYNRDMLIEGLQETP